MISRKAVRSLYTFFNIPEPQYLESVRFVNNFTNIYWYGISFNELQLNIKRRLLEQRIDNDRAFLISPGKIIVSRSTYDRLGAEILRKLAGTNETRIDIINDKQWKDSTPSQRMKL